MIGMGIDPRRYVLGAETIMEYGYPPESLGRDSHKPVLVECGCGNIFPWSMASLHSYNGPRCMDCLIEFHGGKRMLTQNHELKASGVHGWTLPAWGVRLLDGRTINTCPSAGICAQVCYALSGKFLFRPVRFKHLYNLHLVIDRPDTFENLMSINLAGGWMRPTGKPRVIDHLGQPTGDRWLDEWLRSGGVAVRIHDAGDFFSDSYTAIWLRLATKNPDILFYCYTKEVSRFGRMVLGKAPENFRWIFSFGGKQDAGIDIDVDRHADVFHSFDAMKTAGYVNQAGNDLLAITLQSNKIGVPTNNIPAFRKLIGSKRFSEIQREGWNGGLFT